MKRFMLAALALLLPVAVSAQSVTLTAVADTYLQAGEPNQNNGGTKILRVQAAAKTVCWPSLISQPSPPPLARQAWFPPNFACTSWITATTGGPDRADRRRAPHEGTLDGKRGNLELSSGYQPLEFETRLYARLEYGRFPSLAVPTDADARGCSPEPASGMGGFRCHPRTSLHFLPGRRRTSAGSVRKMDETESGRVDYSSREGAFAPQLVITTGVPAATVPNPDGHRGLLYPERNRKRESGL